MVVVVGRRRLPACLPSWRFRAAASHVAGRPISIVRLHEATTRLRRAAVLPIDPLSFLKSIRYKYKQQLFTLDKIHVNSLSPCSFFGSVVFQQILWFFILVV
jgi:hypothetical protein